jgi:hypothetical protein
MRAQPAIRRVASSTSTIASVAGASRSQLRLASEYEIEG